MLLGTLAITNFCSNQCINFNRLIGLMNDYICSICTKVCKGEIGLRIHIGMMKNEEHKEKKT